MCCCCCCFLGCCSTCLVKKNCCPTCLKKMGKPILILPGNYQLSRFSSARRSLCERVLSANTSNNFNYIIERKASSLIQQLHNTSSIQHVFVLRALTCSLETLLSLCVVDTHAITQCKRTCSSFFRKKN